MHTIIFVLLYFVVYNLICLAAEQTYYCYALAIVSFIDCIIVCMYIFGLTACCFTSTITFHAEVYAQCA